MTQSNSLPSALKVAAEVDAALAQAGLAGPQVEREAIPMYLAMLHELIDWQSLVRAIGPKCMNDAFSIFYLKPIVTRLAIIVVVRFGLIEQFDE